jgi:hypothetical protein
MMDFSVKYKKVASFGSEWKIIICHTYRKGNFCADALVNLACEIGDLMVYEQCPAQTKSCFQDYIFGITTYRLVLY